MLFDEEHDVDQLARGELEPIAQVLVEERSTDRRILPRAAHELDRTLAREELARRIAHHGLLVGQREIH